MGYFLWIFTYCKPKQVIQNVAYLHSAALYSYLFACSSTADSFSLGFVIVDLLRALYHFPKSCQCQDCTNLSFIVHVSIVYLTVCVEGGRPMSPGFTHQPFLPEEDTEERSVSFPPLPRAAGRATDAFYFSRCYLKLWLAGGMGRALYGRPHGFKKKLSQGEKCHNDLRHHFFIFW